MLIHNCRSTFTQTMIDLRQWRPFFGRSTSSAWSRAGILTVLALFGLASCARVVEIPLRVSADEREWERLVASNPLPDRFVVDLLDDSADVVPTVSLVRTAL